MQAYLEKFAFKAIFAAAVVVGAATLWLLTANSAAAAGGGSLDLSKTLMTVSSTVTSTTKSADTTVSSTLSATTHTAAATTSQMTQQLAAQPLTSVLATTTSTAQQLVKSTVHTATSTAFGGVHHVLKGASRTVSTVTGTLDNVAPLLPNDPILPVTPVVPTLPLAGQPSTPRDPLGGTAGSTPWLSATQTFGERASASRASVSDSGTARPTTPQRPQPLPTQPGNVPSDGVGGAASQASTRPISGLGFDILLLLAIFTLLAGKATHFRYANTRKGISLPCQLPSG